MSMAASPTPRCAMSARRSRASPKAAAWSPSRAPISRRTIRPGATDFIRLQERGRVVFSAADRRRASMPATAPRIDTRLTVIDRVPAEDPAAFPAALGMAPDAATLLDWVIRHVPPRSAGRRLRRVSRAATPAPRIAREGSACGFARASPRPVAAQPVADAGVELAYETSDWTPRGEACRISEALYEGYALQSIRIPGAKPHPTRLVQSAAMASVAPPKPSLPPASAARASSADGPAVRRPARKRDLCRRGACRLSSPAHGPSMRPSTSSRPRPRTPRTPSASAAAGCWATAPAPARAARSPASCSTIGSRAAAAPSGSRNPTS